MTDDERNGDRAARAGEVIEASTGEFTAECYRNADPPPLGSLVTTSDGDVEIFGVVHHAARPGSTAPAPSPPRRGRRNGGRSAGASPRADGAAARRVLRRRRGASGRGRRLPRPPAEAGPPARLRPRRRRGRGAGVHPLAALSRQPGGSGSPDADPPPRPSSASPPAPTPTPSPSASPRARNWLASSPADVQRLNTLLRMIRGKAGSCLFSLPCRGASRRARPLRPPRHLNPLSPGNLCVTPPTAPRIIPVGATLVVAQGRSPGRRLGPPALPCRGDSRIARPPSESTHLKPLPLWGDLREGTRRQARREGRGGVRPPSPVGAIHESPVPSAPSTEASLVPAAP